MSNIMIGTSGWLYDSWNNNFYPAKLPDKEKLEYYANEFDTVEINNSFYRLPEIETFKNWSKKVPKGFVFAVKVSRFLTHNKKLKDPEEPWKLFLDHAKVLRTKLGPLLLQFPQNWHLNEQRLQQFLEQAYSVKKNLRLVFELRNETWHTPSVMRLLAKYNAAWCIADSSQFKRFDEITADFTYIRYHGREHDKAPDYSKTVLKKEAERIKRIAKQGIQVYAYFNNDTQCRAIYNARTLREFLD